MEGSHHYSDLPYVQHEHWMDRNSYQAQHHSPLDEYSQYGFASSPPMQPGFATQMHPQRPALQPIVTTTWPSMLASQQNQQPNVYNQPHPPTHSMPQQSQPQPPSIQTSPSSATPHLGSSHSGQTASTPRRTLTDNDRRKMCQYHEEHPTKKQTEIGEIFGVERSTVSKVLRQKEKYLRQDEGSRSPVKGPKKNKPDLDRALAKWATNQQSKGIRVTDDNIQKQARFFWHAAGNTSDPPVKIDSPSWLEKFKQKNNLTSGGTSSKRRSPRMGDDGGFSPISPEGGMASDATPMSPEDALSRNVSPTSASETQSAHSLRRQSSSGYDGLGIRGASGLRAPLHSQSNTSLSSAFTEATGPTAFSSENTSVGSPVISPDVITSSSYFPPTQSVVTPTSAIPPQRNDPPPRSRSQTFPSLIHSDVPYISPPQSANTSSPIHTSTAAVFDSPATDMPPPPAPPKSIHSHSHSPLTHSPLSPHHNPHNLAKTKSTPHLSTTTRPAYASPPSFGEAKRGLEAAVAYLKSQGLGNDSADVAAINSVMMKMQVKGASAGAQREGAMALPGGLHRIPEQEFGREGDEDLMVGVETDDGSGM